LEGDLQIGNERVVPYNKFLLMKYNAHINVEVATSVRSIKYLMKYVSKGNDSIKLVKKGEFQNNDNELEKMDEIKHHLDCRYVSAHEAVWKLLSCKMTKFIHSVIRLAVHLEG
jgi:hypothetical protein